jgi:hypothetical protein
MKKCCWEQHIRSTNLVITSRLFSIALWSMRKVHSELMPFCYLVPYIIRSVGMFLPNGHPLTAALPLVEVLRHICLSSELSSCSRWRKSLKVNTRMDNSLKHLWGCFWWLVQAFWLLFTLCDSYVTLTCALSRMKRLFTLSPNSLNAMAIWQMLSRCISWILMGQRMLHADAALWHVYFSYGLVKPQS